MPGGTLMLISARLDGPARLAVASGRWPRKDFFELARALGADVIDYGTVDAAPGWRNLSRVIGMPATQALIAFSRRGRYNRIFSDGEHVGIPLALLLGLCQHRWRHVTVGHSLASRSKRVVFRWLRPQRRLDSIVVHVTRQQCLAGKRLGLPPSRIALLPYQVDPLFWTPPPMPAAKEVICSTGLAYRDYPTLIAAVNGMSVRLTISAGSYWSRHRSTTRGVELPPNIEVTSLDYLGLRDLYARSQFVIVPLLESDHAAGITTILEAMSMGKAVIVTATRGQDDVVRGRLCTDAGISGALLGGPGPFGVSGPLAEAETGLYVPVGDAIALRGAIHYLLNHPDEAARMGAAGRRLVQEHMSLDLFVRRLVALLDDMRERDTEVAETALRPDTPRPPLAVPRSAGSE